MMVQDEKSEDHENCQDSSSGDYERPKQMSWRDGVLGPGGYFHPSHVVGKVRGEDWRGLMERLSCKEKVECGCGYVAIYSAKFGLNEGKVLHHYFCTLQVCFCLSQPSHCFFFDHDVHGCLQFMVWILQLVPIESHIFLKLLLLFRFQLLHYIYFMEPNLTQDYAFSCLTPRMPWLQKL